MQGWMFDGLPLLRYEPTEMRIRVRAGGTEIADTTRAMLVWEPRRIVPSYAVPLADLRCEPAESTVEPVPARGRLLDPGIPFVAHTSPGTTVDVVAGDTRFAGAGFRLEDEALAEYVVLDFWAFDEWLGEDEVLVAHPRDPYHRVDVRQSSRTVRLEVDGVLLAESSRPVLVFETNLPMRYYLPRADVVAELVPSDRSSACAYKGHATYFSAAGYTDLAWSYAEPLDGATQLAGLIAFLDDKLTVSVDGRHREQRPSPGAVIFRDRLGLKQTQQQS
ncbi:uncharacterized protein (DUF427 family) [Kribbella amoyensis]|uniref:Uncharacterized protein (DUF427 family) n=2 Tax=Kribbella amoyensis TaxID=996641 RepID=A0A561BUR6_9ACTN|nr:uncharacterized protein (DUF427 family) [Kribbella amoyensis]